MSEHQDDMVIAVMGSTGTGKSSFIKLLSGDTSIHVGDSLESETSEIQVVPFRDPETGRNVTIVDTPGFDDSRAGISDTKVLKKIAEFLLETYDDKRKLSGLVYLQRISDPRFGGQSGRNLAMFRNLCGTKAYENIVVLTTFWDKVSSEQGDKREEQLKTRFFKDLVEGHARFMPHNLTLESARNVLRHISTLNPTNIQIQEEIRLQGKTLENTAAGSMRREEVERIVAEHDKEMKGLKDELDAMWRGNSALRQELEEERVRLQRELARWENEKAELKKGLDGARKAQEQFRADAAKEKEKRERWRQDQEHKWKSQFDEQKRGCDEKMRQQRKEYERRRWPDPVREEATGLQEEYERLRQEAAREFGRQQEYEEEMRRLREDERRLCNGYFPDGTLFLEGPAGFSGVWLKGGTTREYERRRQEAAREYEKHEEEMRRREDERQQHDGFFPDGALFLSGPAGITGIWLKNW